jgi:hypothetical protein
LFSALVKIIEIKLVTTCGWKECLLLICNFCVFCATKILILSLTQCYFSIVEIFFAYDF